MIERIFCVRGFIALLLAWLLCIHTRAQDIPSDQLQYDPRPSVADTARVHTLIRSGVALRWKYSDSAMQFFEEAKEKSIDYNYPDGAARALLNIGVTYFAKGDYEKCFKAYDEAEPYCRSALYHRDNLIWSRYNEIGTTYLFMGVYDRSAYYFHQALNKAPDAASKAFLYNNISTVHLRLNDWPAAYFFLNEGMNLAREVGAYSTQLPLMSNMGNLYASRAMPHIAIAVYLDGLMMAMRMRDSFMIQRFYQGIGEVLLDHESADKAIPFFQSVLEEGKGNVYYNQLNPLYSLARAYTKMGWYQQAERTVKKGISIAHETGLLENIISAYGTLIDIYEQTRQYDAAFQALRIQTRLRDSLMSADEKRAIKQLEIRFQISEKDKALAQNNILILRQKEQLLRKNVVIGMITVGAVILAILSILLWALYRNNQHKQQLQSEYLRNREQEEELNVMRALIDGEEKERARLARELHDGIGGMLAAVQLSMSTFQKRNKDTANEIIPIVKLLDETSEEVRKTAHNLMPDNLAKHGFVQAIHTYCDQIKSTGEIEIDLYIQNDLGTLGGKVELSLYRIVQQLLQNIIRHAEATRASIQIHKMQEKIGIMIEDNGKGFKPDARHEGMGLDNIRSRVNALQGIFSLDSAPGQGTNVYIEIDLQRMDAKLH